MFAFAGPASPQAGRPLTPPQRPGKLASGCPAPQTFPRAGKFSQDGCPPGSQGGAASKMHLTVTRDGYTTFRSTSKTLYSKYVPDTPA